MEIESFIQSRNAEFEHLQKLAEWEGDLVAACVEEKSCACIKLLNGQSVKALPLITSESRGLLAKLRVATRDRAFALHRMIMIVWAPAVLRTTAGSLTAKIYNQSTGESIELCSDHPVAQAAVFVGRWPRAVLADQRDGLALLVSVSGVPIKKDGLIGVMHPVWEDKLSSKMVYEKQLPSLTFPIEEQEPALYIKDTSVLKSLVHSRIHVGAVGHDIAKQRINHQAPLLLPHKKAGRRETPVRKGLKAGKGSKLKGDASSTGCEGSATSVKIDTVPEDGSVTVVGGVVYGETRPQEAR